MNRLVIVGNGFDLAHKMKTSYKDFLFWLLKDHMLQVLRNDDYNGYFQSDDLRVYISEPKIRDTVRDLMCFNDIKNHVRYTTSHEINELRKTSMSIRQLNVDGKIIACISNAYLSDVILGDFEKWVDLEWVYFQNLVKLSKEIEKNRRMIENYQNWFENIKKYLKQYLAEIEISPKNPKFKEILLRSTTFETGRGKSVNEMYERCLFLNFNYTNTLSIYFRDKASSEILNIHGAVNDNEIIFGFGDENEQNYAILESLNDNLLLQNSKSNKYLLNNKYAQLLSFIDEPFEVEILGHSCGITDRTLLKMIFESENCVRIIPYYFVDENGNDNYSEIVTNISRNFSDKYLFRKKVVDRTMCQKIPQL